MPFKEKYFAAAVELWADRGLPACQSLASRMQAGEVVFEYLDAPQLLKHALGLATHLGERFSLHYFYYDWPGAESQQHQAEIREFANQVDAGLAFTAANYQELFARLQAAAAGEHVRYLEYLYQRYFGAGG